MHDDTQIWDVMWHFCLQRPILRLTKASRHLNRFWLKYMQSCEGRMTLTRRFGLGTCQGMTEQAWLASHSQFQVALNLSLKEMKQIGMPRPNPNSRECSSRILKKSRLRRPNPPILRSFRERYTWSRKTRWFCKRFLFDNSYLEWLEVKHPMGVKQPSPRKLAKVVWHRMLHAKATTQAAKVVY